VRTLVTTFALGAAVVGVLVFVGALAVVTLADASGRSDVSVALGPLVLLAFERGPRGTGTTFGPALVLLPLLGGALNAVGAALLARD